MIKSKILSSSIIYLLLCFLGGNTTVLAADFPTNQWVKFENRWKTNEAINVEKGPIVSSLIHKGAYSAMWIIKPVKGTKYFRIENRWKPGFRVHIERGKLECTKMKDGAWSAMWELKKVPGTKFYRIENRWKAGFRLHREKGPLVCSKIKDGAWSAMWNINPIAGAKIASGNTVAKVNKVYSQHGTVVMEYKYKDPNYKVVGECSVPDWLPSADITSTTDKYLKIFQPACEQHDKNYQAPWRLAGFKEYAGKEIADEKFHKDMTKICVDRYNNFVEELHCKNVAMVWYNAVNKTAKGKAAFNSGQTTAANKCDKSSISKGGYLSVYSDAGYVTEVKVNYLLKGKRVYKSGKISALTTEEVPIPIGATDINLNVEGIACGLSFKKHYSRSPVKCFKVWGTIFDTEWREINCK